MSIHFCFSVLTFRFNIFLSSCTSLLHLFLKISVCKRISSRNLDINTIQTNLRYQFIFKALWKLRFSITPYYLTSMLVHIWHMYKRNTRPSFFRWCLQKSKTKTKNKMLFIRYMYILHFLELVIRCLGQVNHLHLSLTPPFVRNYVLFQILGRSSQSFVEFCFWDIYLMHCPVKPTLIHKCKPLYWNKQKNDTSFTVFKWKL